MEHKKKNTLVLNLLFFSDLTSIGRNPFGTAYIFLKIKIFFFALYML